MENNKNKKKDYTIGSWLTISHPTIVDIMSKAGFNWLTIDLEHSSITIKEVEEMLRIIQLNKVKGFVRLSSNESTLIKRVMDAGADGIIVPMIETKDDAFQTINSLNYPPFGKRGMGLSRAQEYGNKFEEYLKWMKNGPSIILQIESIKGVDNLEDILSFNEISGIFIGPYDLSASLGLPGQFESPKYLDAINKIKKICSNKKVKLGIHVVKPDINELKIKINEGYYYIAYSVDTIMLDNQARQHIQINK